MVAEVATDWTIDDPFYNQHYATQITGGNLLLIDNGDAKPGQNAGALGSRAVEYALDNATKSATKVPRGVGGAGPSACVGGRARKKEAASGSRRNT